MEKHSGYPPLGLKEVNKNKLANIHQSFSVQIVSSLKPLRISEVRSFINAELGSTTSAGDILHMSQSLPEGSVEQCLWLHADGDRENCAFASFLHSSSSSGIHSLVTEIDLN